MINTPKMAPLTVDTPSIPLSLASCSIGLPRHSLRQKLEAAARAGFRGIELSFPDILAHARELRCLGQLDDDDKAEIGAGADASDEIQPDDYATLAQAARHIRHLCATHGLAVLVLQPFANFEGWDARAQPEERRAAFDRARGWLWLMDAAGTDMLQVGATDTPAHKLVGGGRPEDEDKDKDKAALAAAADDLAALADLLRHHNPRYRLAYENWCWATHAPAWRDAWDLVRRADRPNIGLCLDTFQSAGGEWGDPTTASGLVASSEGEGEGAENAEAAVTKNWRASLRALTQTVPADKIYFLQISDAYRVDPPLAPHPEPNDDSGLRPRGRWSHDYRPLPYDGGYLPIADFTRAVLETGFRGWFSVEVFDGQFDNKYGDNLGKFADKARDSTRKLIEEAAAMESL